MKSANLQNNIIRKVLDTKDNHLLDYLDQLLNSEDNSIQYTLSAEEKAIISESMNDYKSGKTISNEEVISRNEKWLKE